MKPIIEINKIGKKYPLQTSQRYLALRDEITSSLQQIFRNTRKKKEDFWALQDINLNVKAGERLGIIGKNGAGKSTLLKILSRITTPTTGYCVIRGRLASLLEVGTGFHPELTGRENIYLNGSILGLKKQEIDKQFDAIVDFSGMQAFLNTPLKNYSTGMELRLAFAVVAHLEPEILLIDEILAVGDIEFQKKCIGKMEEVSKSGGRTILFVSHNMNYIASLCNKGVLLDKGKIVQYGTANEVISKYFTEITNRSAFYVWNEDEQPGNDIVRLRSLRIVDSALKTKENYKVNEKIGIEMQYEVLQSGHILWLGHNLYNQHGINVFDTHNINSSYYKIPHTKGKYSALVWIPSNFLNTGNYTISSAIFNHRENVIHFHEKEVLLFNVYDVFDQDTARGLSNGDFPGVVRPLFEWTIDKL